MSIPAGRREVAPGQGARVDAPHHRGARRGGAVGRARRRAGRRQQRPAQRGVRRRTRRRWSNRPSCCASGTAVRWSSTGSSAPTPTAAKTRRNAVTKPATPRPPPRSTRWSTCGPCWTRSAGQIVVGELNRLMEQQRRRGQAQRDGAHRRPAPRRRPGRDGHPFPLRPDPAGCDRARWSRSSPAHESFARVCELAERHGAHSRPGRAVAGGGGHRAGRVRRPGPSHLGVPAADLHRGAAPGDRSTRPALSASVRLRRTSRALRRRPHPALHRRRRNHPRQRTTLLLAPQPPPPPPQRHATRVRRRCAASVDHRDDCDEFAARPESMVTALDRYTRSSDQ